MTDSVCVKKTQTVFFVQPVEIFLKTFLFLALLSDVAIARAWGFWKNVNKSKVVHTAILE